MIDGEWRKEEYDVKFRCIELAKEENPLLVGIPLFRKAMKIYNIMSIEWAAGGTFEDWMEPNQVDAKKNTKNDCS